MLTEQQLDQLQPLTQHPKYGQLLKDAIETWKQEDVTSIYGSFGLSYLDSKFSFCNDNKKGCCLLGAALYDKQIKSYVPGKIFTFSVCINFNLAVNEVRSLFSGFDGCEYHESHCRESHVFGFTVRRIVNPIHYFYY